MTPMDLYHREAIPGDSFQRRGDRLLRVPAPAQQVVIYNARCDSATGELRGKFDGRGTDPVQVIHQFPVRLVPADLIR